MKNEIFYQDFLMDIPYDDNEYPIVDYKFINNIDDVKDISIKRNLFDNTGDFVRKINFSTLLELYKQEDWIKLFNYIPHIDILILVDDVKLVNMEVEFIKEFYLKVYYYHLSVHNNKLFLKVN